MLESKWLYVNYYYYQGIQDTIWLCANNWLLRQKCSTKKTAYTWTWKILIIISVFKHLQMNQVSTSNDPYYNYVVLWISMKW